MRKQKTKRATAPAAPQHMNVRLSIDERDAIDRAKGRIRRFSALITAHSHVDTDMLPLDGIVVDAEAAIGELSELMYEAALEIDGALTAADARREGGGQ